MSGPWFRDVEHDIRGRHLVQPQDVVVVAVSGGADSVFLLHALHALAPRWRLRLQVAHLNHGWRGPEARADAAFVAAIAQRLGWPFRDDEVNAPALARSHHLAPEDAARRLRYAFLRDVCREAGTSLVATGHNEDDQVETVLLACLRGSGLGGIAAMPWKGPLPAAHAEGIEVIRPLLGQSRGRIRETLRGLGLAWREDATNAEPHLLRNRLRAELLPVLEGLAPGYRTTIVRALGLAKQAHGFLQSSAQAAGAGLFAREGSTLRAPRDAFLALDPALHAETLRWAVAELQGDTRGCEWSHVEGALQIVSRGRGGAVAWLTPHLRLCVRGGQIVLGPASPPADAEA